MKAPVKLGSPRRRPVRLNEEHEQPPRTDERAIRRASLQAVPRLRQVVRDVDLQVEVERVQPVRAADAHVLRDEDAFLGREGRGVEGER